MIVQTHQIADIFGVTPRTVYDWGMKGCPRVDNERNSWNVTDVLMWWVENIYESERGDSISERSARDRYWLAKADTAELDLSERRGELAPIATFVEAMTRRVNELSVGFQMLALRLAPKIILSISGENELPDGAELTVRKILEDEFWKFRDKFSREGKLY